MRLIFLNVAYYKETSDYVKMILQSSFPELVFPNNDFASYILSSLHKRPKEKIALVSGKIIRISR